MEFWDIYDENKQLTGRTMKRNDWNMKPGDFHLTVLGVLQRYDGKYLITQRRLDKEWAPGHWEIPGGGVRAGESSKEAAVREIKEETGIDVSNVEVADTLTYKRVNPQEKNNYFVDVYKFVTDFKDEDVKIQKDEVLDFSLASIEEIHSYAERGIFLHYDSIKEIFK